VLWTRAFGGPGTDWGRSVQQTVDSGYVVVGYAGSLGAGKEDVCLIKTDAEGNSIIRAPATRREYEFEIGLVCKPSPFSRATGITIEPRAPISAPMSLCIRDLQGRIVRVLAPRPYSLTWDGTDDRGRALPSGTYFVRLDIGSEHATMRVVLQR